MYGFFISHAIGHPPQLTICNFRGSLRAKRQDFFHKLPGETFFNVWICKQKGYFAYNRLF
ncbi:hypothetical protein M2137_000614 [Parabacteroides sp. PFB2-10]|nr:hypothetical protein [Parabacteroides sp. PFB2-10]